MGEAKRRKFIENTCKVFTETPTRGQFSYTGAISGRLKSKTELNAEKFMKGEDVELTSETREKIDRLMLNEKPTFR